jgi:hypothetical protein
VVPKNKKKTKTVSYNTKAPFGGNRKKNLMFLREPKVLKQKMVAWNLEHALLGILDCLHFV